jgi:hypothetical protein
MPLQRRFNAGSSDRGWKAAPTIKPTPMILRLTHIRLAGFGVSEFKGRP